MSVRGWCRAHWIPYVHGCVWDRECRTEFYLWRIALMWGRVMVYVDLPGYYKDHDPDMIETRDDGDPLLLAPASLRALRHAGGKGSGATFRC